MNGNYTELHLEELVLNEEIKTNKDIYHYCGIYHYRVKPSFSAPEFLLEGLEGALELRSFANFTAAQGAAV